MYCQIEFELDNDCFQQDLEGSVAMITQKAAQYVPILLQEALEPGNELQTASRHLIDINGNSIGSVTVGEGEL